MSGTSKSSPWANNHWGHGRDGLLPNFGHSHAVELTSNPEHVYKALWNLRLTDDPIIRSLFKLRGAAGRLATLQGFLDSGFVLLSDEPGREIALGFVGKPWRPTG